jgi:pyrroline-5-carboxylate reductase
VYRVIEALSEGGELAGLPPNVATQLAVQTVRGAAEMVLQSDVPIETLIERVASRGGTTVAGLAALEEGGLRSTLIGAVEAATQRSIELGKK